MRHVRTEPRAPSWQAALASALVVAAGFAALLHGLDVQSMLSRAPAALVAILPTRDAETPPPPPPPPPQENREAARGEPAPEGRKGAAVVAPAPALVLASPLPIVSAPTAGNGGSGSTGSGAGSGSGAGGSGNGSGSGGSGGSGAANAGVAMFPRQIGGRMHYSDLPSDLRKARVGAEITVRYRIGVDGRVSGCTVIASSGRPELDAATCAQITDRFRFRPARDGSGQPVAFVMTETQGWDNSAR